MAHSHFSKHERNEISVLLRKGYSRRDIAKVLEKNHSAVVREINRNSVKGRYDPKKAHHKSYVRRHRAKYQNMKIHGSKIFLLFLERKLKQSWTPEQIAARWKKDYPREKHFSFKSIYKYLYSAWGQKFCKYLPSKQYVVNKRRRKKLKREIIKNRVSIDKRPKIINIRKRFGDFEADVMGAVKTDSQRLAALVERKSRKLFVLKVQRLKYAMDGFKTLLKPYQDILKSVTFDNGVENARHLELGTKTYFAHPYSAWEKGQMENTFKRLRRFIKKKFSLREYTHREIKHFVNLMNNTPRKCLNWKTPNEVFDEFLIKYRKNK